ncbi:hypothetical protein [Trujillonella endophytica]|uniref:DUF4386 family protein n=1 Tax=Trujillonella endophytica TaxID=673521 RepID=A0A1H8VKL9_9ACTN|nr:hypothetical protein [Trujillella endophytica]SEP15824.1 hypothetical protein SAMN05660991_03627 [Trujillella endophytica]
MTVPAPARAPAPGTRFRRIGGAVSLIASGALVCASLAMIPYGNRTDAEYLQTGADHTADVLWAAVVAHYGYLLLLPAALTLVHLARRRARRIALAAMVLTGLGAGLSGLAAVDLYDVALATELPPDRALHVFEVAGGHGQAALIAVPSILGLALGTTLALAAAWWARAVPVYPVVLGAVGWGVVLVVDGDAWLPSIGTALVAVALAWAGAIVLRMRDDVWDRM